MASNTELFLFLCLLIIAFISFYSRSLLLSNAYLILGTIYFMVVDEFFAEALNVPTLVGNIDFTF
ncbi:MAG: hypothetical protein MJ246_00245 [Clostridia bacterium]|nr:hypothetical protein [Clostridia bacterium]